MSNLYVNIDSNSTLMPFLNKIAQKETVHPEDLHTFVDSYAGTRVTEVLYCVFCQYSNVETAFWSTYADKYLQKEENGIAVDYTPQYQALYRLNKEYDIEPYGVFIDRCRAIGVRPWLSVRMNDCHDPRTETSFLRSDFFYEAEKKGWKLGAPYAHHMCYDYAAVEVRRRMLGYIAEQLEKYDVDGLELDFMREITCFRYADGKTGEYTAVMNEFIREVRALTDRAAAKYGHPVRLGVRLMRSLEQSRYFGFDAEAWAAAGLVDMVNPTPRFARSDSGIPVAAWKAALPGVEIAAGLETLAEAFTLDRPCFMSAELARGHAAAFLSGGADSIYLFNYFHTTSSEADDELLPGGELARDQVLYRTCGTPEELYGHPLRFAVIPQDDHVSGLPAIWKPLPLQLNAQPQQLELRTGRLPAGKKLSLILGFAEGGPDSCTVTLNGIPCTGFAPVDMTKLPGMPQQPVNHTAPADGFWRCEVLDACSGEVQTVALYGAGRLVWCELTAV